MAASIMESAINLTPWQYEYRVKFDDGTIRVLYGNAIPHREADGSVLWNGFTTDITAKKQVEQELLATQLFNQHIIDTIPVSVFWKDTHLIYQGCNELFARDAGFNDPQDIIGKNDFDMGWKQEATLYQKDDRDVLEHGKAKMLIEETQTTPDGKIITLLTNKIPLRNAAGEITGILGTYIDITERKQAEAKEREVQDRIIKIARQVPGVIYQFKLSLEGQPEFKFVSESMHTIFGVHPEELYADARIAISKVHPEDKAAVMASIIKSATTLTPWQQECRVILDDGTMRYVYGSSVPEQEADGSVLWHGFLSDITEHKITEARIRQLSKAVDQSPVSIVITDTNGIIQYVNPKFVQLTGYSAEEALGNKPSILKSGQTTDEEYKQLWQTITSGETWRGDLQNVKKNGELYWESASISPVINEQGEITHFLAVKEDITERKKAEAEIARMAITLEIAPNAITVHDFDGNFHYANQRNFDLHGYSKEEFMQINLHDLDVPVSEKLIKARLEELRERKEMNFEAGHYRKDGTIVPLEIYARLINWGKSDAVLSMATDITERLEAEKKMQELLQNYEFVNKATSDTIWEWDLKLNTITRNESYTKTFGYPSGTIFNSLHWAKTVIHPDDYKRVKGIIENCINNKQENWQAEYRYRAADGSYRYVYDRAFVLFDQDGNSSRMYGAITDLTEKQNLKHELADQQLKQQKQLLEVNIQAHEEERNELGKELHDNISQMLATVKMYLGLAKAGRSIPEFDLISKSYEYIEETITELRKLSHSLAPPSLGEIGLQEALKDLIHIANMVKEVNVKLVVDKKIKGGELDKKIELMIYRIVQEQLNNINKYASAKNVTITVKKEKNTLLLTITDDGVGFNTANRSKGIGLRNMTNRVEYYSGTLDIITAPGAGCTIMAKIPLDFNTLAI